MGLRRIQDAAIEGKTVLVRVDYNVPMAGGQIADDGRIRASLPTLQHLIDGGAKTVLITHLGRPKGEVVESLRLTPIAARLQEILGREVKALDDCVGPSVKEAIDGGGPGDVFLLENVRFRREESLNEAAFARQLADLGEIYVDDAFATVHRSHASTVGIADVLPSYAGMLMQTEIDALTRVLEAPEKPYVAVIGGKKARSKLGALHDLVSRVDEVLIGGGVAFTFLAAFGIGSGGGDVDGDLLDEIREIGALAKERGTTIMLPVDAVIAETITEDAETGIAAVDQVPEGWGTFDIGPKTVEEFRKHISGAKTIVWTGPMGAFEMDPFSAGTRGIGEAIASSSAYSVIGGGETGEAVKRFGFEERVSYISTGGGACLAMLRGKSLPALNVLQE